MKTTPPCYRVGSSLLTVLLASCVFGLQSCSTVSPSEGHLNAQYRFAVEYVNQAWAAAYSGYLIDSNGTRWNFSNPSRVGMAADTAFDARQELGLRFGNLQRATGIDKALVQSYEQSVKAHSGVLLPGMMHCADAGTVRVSSMRYDTLRWSYFMTTLKEEGDVCRSHSDSVLNTIGRALVRLDSNFATWSCGCP